MTDLERARVLVTGASGFIGSHLVRRLVEGGADVHALSSSVSSAFPVRLVDLRDRIVLHGANLIDRGALEELMRRVRPSVVFHLGAYTHVGKSWQRVDECIQVNIQGTVNLLGALEEVGYERFVYCGSSDVYGDIDVPFRESDEVNPLSPYAVSKYAAENYCRMLHAGVGRPIVCIRPFNAYGPAQTPDRVIPEIIVRALRGQELKMTSGTQTREFNFVEDLAEGFVQIATTEGVEGEIFNLGSGEETSMRDLTTTILDLMGNPIEPRFGALPDRPGEIWRRYSDSSKVQTMVGWQPRHAFRQGLELTIDWYSRELGRSGSTFEL